MEALRGFSKAAVQATLLASAALCSGLDSRSAEWDGPSPAGAQDFQRHVEGFLKRMTENEALLDATREGRAFYSERTLQIRNYLEGREYGRVWQTLYSPTYWKMARRLGLGIEFADGPFRVLSVSVGENAVRWQERLVLRERRFDVWFSSENPARPRVQIRSYLTSRQYHPCRPVYQSGTDTIRSVAWRNDYFHKTMKIEADRVVWDVRVIAPFGAGPLRGGTCLTTMWCSPSPLLWDCRATLKNRDDEDTVVDLPALGTVSWGRHEFKGVTCAEFTSDQRYVKLAAEPIGACAETYQGMTVVGHPGLRDSWVFRLDYAPPGENWEAGELARFRVVFQVKLQ